MPDAVIHPTPQELTAFGLGKLPERAAAVVAAHLESCPACRQAVAGVSADSFLNKVRDAKQDKTALPPSLAKPTNAPSSAGQPAIPIVPCPNIPPELANHPKYRISRELGRGGMGVVYQGWHKEMNRQIVIKVINRALLDKPESLDRFRREIQAAAQLSHPNIVTAHDAERAGELHMLVMEFVPGQNLGEVLEKQGRLSVAHACHYMRQTALGLQHAHEAGLVHRDIKPQNLIRTPKGRIKILDFGLAKMVRERETGKGLTPSDACMGTAEFIAPEQAQNAAKADIRADLYSLGCTLYCLLAGRPPFREDTWMNTVLAHIQKTPQPLTELRPDVPERLWRVVARLMAKEPAQRYQKPIEVVQALAPFVKPGAAPNAKSVAAPAPGASSLVKGTRIAADTNEIKNILREVPGKTPPKAVPAKEAVAAPFTDLTDTGSASKNIVRVSEAAKPYLARWWRRPGAIAVAISVSLALIVTAVIINKVREQFANSKTDEHSTSNGDMDRFESPPAKSTKPEPKDSPNPQKKSSEDSSTPPKPPRVPIADDPLEKGNDYDLAAGRRFVHFGKDRTQVVLFTRRNQHHARVYDLATGQALTPPLVHQGRVVYASFSPDGQRVVTASWDNTAKVWNIATGQALTLQHAGWVIHASFSPDGQRVVTASLDKTARIWDAATGQALTPPIQHEGGGFHACFSPDGKRLVTTFKSTARILDAASGETLTPPLKHDAWVWHASFSPDGQRVVTASKDKTARIWDAATGRELIAFLRHEDHVRYASFSPDGQRVVSASNDNTARIWDAATGNEVTPPLKHDSFVQHAAFSPNGKWVVTASADKTARIWDAATGKEVTPPLENKSEVWFASFSRDGRHVVTIGLEDTARLWDAESGKELNRVTITAMSAADKPQVNLPADSSIDDLRKALKDEDPDVREKAAVKLSELGPKAEPAVFALAETLNDKKNPVRVRRFAAIAIAHIGTKAGPVASEVAKVLKTSEPTEVRRDAAEALFQINYPANEAALPAILKAIVVDNDSAVRYRCVWALYGVNTAIKFREVGADKALEKALDDIDANVRYSAARKLAHILRHEAPDKAVGVLLEFLTDESRLLYYGTDIKVKDGRPDPQLNTGGDARFQAAIALSWLGDKAAKRPDVAEALRKAAKDKDEKLKVEAQKAMKELKIEE